MKSVIDKVAELHPNEAEAARALLRDVCSGWNKLHDAMLGNLAVGACNNANKFEKLEVDTAKLFMFVQMPGVSLFRCEKQSSSPSLLRFRLTLLFVWLSLLCTWQTTWGTRPSRYVGVRTCT